LSVLVLWFPAELPELFAAVLEPLQFCLLVLNWCFAELLLGLPFAVSFSGPFVTSLSSHCGSSIWITLNIVTSANQQRPQIVTRGFPSEF
jgi:hypothetical protein